MKLLPFLLLISLGFGCAETVTETATQADTDSTTEVSDTLETQASVPILNEVSDTVSISGARVWLFAVNDGEEKPALSTERDGGISMGRLDLENPSAAVEWMQVVSSSDLGSSRVADHWHVFAHGYHWLAFSVQEANASYLLKLDTDFRRISLTAITTNSSLPTNDLFLVEDAEGVTVGHFKPGYGHRLFRMDLDGELIETIDIGGGAATHGNGASAYQTDDGFTVIAGRTLNYLEQAALYKLDFDTEWNLVNQTTLVDEDKKNYSMASGIEQENGFLIVTARVTESSARGQRPSPTQPGGALSDDGGSIIRFVFTADGEEISRETLVETATEHRPHMEQIEDLLITTWDGAGGGSLRVDEIN